MTIRIWPRGVFEWGSTARERGEPVACDRLVMNPDHALFRAVDVNASAPMLFRWLCQLRMAPYSYDLLDNLGRRSPRKLTPGAERLAAGQRVMTIFRLIEFEQGQSITILSIGRVFGRVACTYRVQPITSARSRLLVKVLVSYPGPGLLPRRLLLPPGDLVMMRRQLLNLKALAERSERAAI